MHRILNVFAAFLAGLTTAFFAMALLTCIGMALGACFAYLGIPNAIGIVFTVGALAFGCVCAAQAYFEEL